MSSLPSAQVEKPNLVESEKEDEYLIELVVEDNYRNMKNGNTNVSQAKRLAISLNVPCPFVACFASPPGLLGLC